MPNSIGVKCALFACALSGAVLACTLPSTGTDIAPKHLDAARKAVTAVGATRQLELVLPLILSQMERSYMQFNPELADEFADVFATLEGTFTHKLASFTDRIAADYARQFTEPELKAIAAFHSSVAGKKYFERERQLQKSSARIGREFSEQLGRDIDIAVRAELKKRGHDL